MKAIKIIALILAVLLVLFAARYCLYDVYYRLSYRDLIEKYSTEYEIDEYLMMAMIHTESNFKKGAESSAGAKGLMQLTESTAKWIAKSMGDTDFKVDDLYDPETNIKMGAWYFDNLRTEFGTTELVLAAYNAGRGHVNEWLDDSVISQDGKDYDKVPFPETRKYIRKVLNDEKMYKLLYSGKGFAAQLIQG